MPQVEDGIGLPYADLVVAGRMRCTIDQNHLLGELYQRQSAMQSSGGFETAVPADHDAIENDGIAPVRWQHEAGDAAAQHGFTENIEHAGLIDHVTFDDSQVMPRAELAQR